MSAETRLWEVSHPYYCAEQAFSAPSEVTRYRSWAEFLADWEGVDDDMNLVFRWDWHEGEDWGGSAFTGDPNYRNGILRIFFMGQRKGLFWSHEVDVCRADEPSVRAYLNLKADYLRRLWAPLMGALTLQGPTR